MSKVCGERIFPEFWFSGEWDGNAIFKTISSYELRELLPPFTPISPLTSISGLHMCIVDSTCWDVSSILEPECIPAELFLQNNHRFSPESSLFALTADLDHHRLSHLRPILKAHSSVGFSGIIKLKSFAILVALILTNVINLSAKGKPGESSSVIQIITSDEFQYQIQGELSMNYPNVMTFREKVPPSIELFKLVELFCVSLNGLTCK